MNIAIIGNDEALLESKKKLGDSHQYFHSLAITRNVGDSAEVIFDFNSEWSEESVAAYEALSAPVFLNAVFSTLRSVSEAIKTKGPIFGFCGLPTFFNRPKIELIVNDSDRDLLHGIAKSLNLEYTIVKDQIGMVTPRVIAMIINEAYEALQQGVASREDIDLSMKLGTNYPFGPFEWGDRIGLTNLRTLLTVLGESTGDSRFHPNF